MFCSKHHLPERHKCRGLPSRSWDTYATERGQREPIIVKEPPTLVPAPIERFPKNVSRKTTKTISKVLKGIAALMIIIVIGLFIWAVFIPWVGSLYSSWYNTTNVEYKGSIIGGGDGHSITLYNNPQATNPTYNELLSFLRQDNTDQIPYVYGSFVCADYAEKLYNNAEHAGIRAGYVVVFLKPYYTYDSLGNRTVVSDGILHSLDAFETTDRGLIFIDDTQTISQTGNVSVVNVVVGNLYTPTYLFNNIESFVSYPMGIVNNYEIQWFRYSFDYYN